MTSTIAPAASRSSRLSVCSIHAWRLSTLRSPVWVLATEPRRRSTNMGQLGSEDSIEAPAPTISVVSLAGANLFTTSSICAVSSDAKLTVATPSIDSAVDQLGKLRTSRHPRCG